MDDTPQTQTILGTGPGNDRCGTLEDDGSIVAERCRELRACLCEDSGVGVNGGEY